MRDAVRRLLQVRPPTRIVQVRVPAIVAGRRGLPVLLSAFAVVAAASTAATTSASEARDVVTAPAGTTVLPPVAPPTYSYPGTSSESGTGQAGTATRPAGTGLNDGRTGGSPVTAQLAANGIPSRAVQAYQAAAAGTDCGLPWTVLAAIGRVESDHGRFAGSTLLADGRSDPPIVGIPLDGRPGVAVIRDTDGGKYDGDATYDRAVGPMQFIPSSWASFGVDGDGDGKADPFDIDDATAAAAKYLCRAGGDLSTVAGQRDAVYSYNRSVAYVDKVLALAAVYAGGAPVDDSLAAGGTPPLRTPTLPQATDGDPPAATPPATTTTARRRTPAPSRSQPTPAPPATTTPAPTASATTPTPSPSAPAPTTSAPSPSPTCTPVPSSSPSPSGSITPNGTASAAQTPTPTPTASDTAGAAATGTPTPSPSPTLPPCPS